MNSNKSNIRLIGSALLDMFLNMLQFVGMISTTIGVFAWRTVTFFHKHLTSGSAMRRYGRWIAACYHWCDNTGTLMSEYMVNVIFYRGELGEVSFDVEDEFRDGYVVIREFGDARHVPVNFWCSNRWLVRQGRPAGYTLGQLRTQAMTALGSGVVCMYWGEEKLVPYEMAAMKMLSRVGDKPIPAETMWTPAQDFPDYRRFAANDILTRVS